MPHKNSEILAAWLLHAHRSDPGSPLFPTNEQIEAIIREKPDRWMEAHAVGEAFVKQVQDEEPKSLLETGDAFMRAAKGVHRIQQKLGSFMSTPPVAGRRDGAGK